MWKQSNQILDDREAKQNKWHQLYFLSRIINSEKGKTSASDGISNKILGEAIKYLNSRNQIPEENAQTEEEIPPTKQN